MFICRDKYICGLWSFTPPFQQQTRKAVHYAVLCSLHLVGPIIHSSWRDFWKADKAHKILPQTALFLWIFLCICSVDKERMDDDFKPASMITNLRYRSPEYKLYTCMSRTYVCCIFMYVFYNNAMHVAILCFTLLSMVYMLKIGPF